MGSLIFVFIAIVAGITFFKYQKLKKIRELKNTYEKALSDGNKQEALTAGRAYYSYLRKDKLLTIYDETAINNDISAMSA